MICNFVRDILLFTYSEVMQILYTFRDILELCVVVFTVWDHVTRIDIYSSHAPFFLKITGFAIEMFLRNKFNYNISRPMSSRASPDYSFESNFQILNLYKGCHRNESQLKDLRLRLKRSSILGREEGGFMHTRFEIMHFQLFIPQV